MNSPVIFLPASSFIMKKPFKTTFILLILFSFLQAKVPSWFKKLPETPSGIYLDVGMVGLFSRDSRAREYALNRAAKNIAKQIEMGLKFELSTQSDGRFILGLPDFEEIYEESIYNEVRSNIVVLDSMFTKKHRYYLIQYPATRGKIKIHSEKVSWGEKPDWVNLPPQSKKYYYGTGQLANYISVIRAWDDTDSFARFALGKNICINVAELRKEKQTDQSHLLRQYTTQCYDINISGCKIVERWYDKKNKAYYSLSKSPRGSYIIN
jgi:hypothetical protein